MAPLIGRSIYRALSQLRDPRFRRVVALGVAITLLGFLLLFFGLKWLIGWAIGDGVTLPWIGLLLSGQTLSLWGSLATMAVVSIFLMVPLAQLVQSFFLDDVAAAVESAYYPDLPAAAGAGFRDAALDALQAFGVLVAANLLALVLYVAITPLAPFIFYGLNGYLLGREYFHLAAIRRVGRRQAAALRKRHFAIIWITGIAMVVPLTIPIINLLVPVLGAACFTHLFHGLQHKA